MHVCVDFVSPQPGVATALYNVATGLPSLAFLAFLAWRLQPSLHKLRTSRSGPMATYYALLWGMAGLNAVRCLLQMLHAGSTTSSPGHAALWNTFWLLTRFGMMMLEASVVVFLLQQGHAASGRQALTNTLVVSGGVASADLLTKAIALGAHVSLFLYDPAGDMAWSKWSFWAVHSLLLALCYAAVVALPLTRWRDLLPANASFHAYAAVLLALYSLMAVGALCIGGKWVGGYCFYGVAVWLYFSGLPPLVHVAFLREFLAGADDMECDMLLFHEMRDAGVFDDAQELSFN